VANSDALVAACAPNLVGKHNLLNEEILISALILRRLLMICGFVPFAFRMVYEVGSVTSRSTLNTCSPYYLNTYNRSLTSDSWAMGQRGVERVTHSVETIKKMR